MKSTFLEESFLEESLDSVFEFSHPQNGVYSTIPKLCVNHLIFFFQVFRSFVWLSLSLSLFLSQGLSLSASLSLSLSPSKSLSQSLFFSQSLSFTFRLHSFYTYFQNSIECLCFLLTTCTFI